MEIEASGSHLPDGSRVTGPPGLGAPSTRRRRELRRRQLARLRITAQRQASEKEEEADGVGKSNPELNDLVYDIVMEAGEWGVLFEDLAAETDASRAEVEKAASVWESLGVAEVVLRVAQGTEEESESDVQKGDHGYRAKGTGSDEEGIYRTMATNTFRLETEIFLNELMLKGASAVDKARYEPLLDGLCVKFVQDGAEMRVIAGVEGL